MAVHPKSETSLKQYKGEWNRHWERMGKLKNIIKSAANENLGTIKNEIGENILKCGMTK